MDVKGNWRRWLKVRDLTKGVTYFFRVQARTIAYGPELQANVTAGPAEGKWSSAQGPASTAVPDGPILTAAQAVVAHPEQQKHRGLSAAGLSSKSSCQPQPLHMDLLNRDEQIPGS